MNELSINNNPGTSGVETNSTQIYQPKEKDTATQYFSERAKKLTTAIYIVTNLIPSTDPLRLSIRQFSINLLSFIGISSAGRSLEEVSSEILGLCKKISEMLEIAFFSGYVSEMNFSILKTELDLFANEISGYRGPLVIINPDSLKTKSTPDKMSLTEFSPKPKISKGQKTSPETNKGPSADRVSAPAKSLVDAKKVSRKESIISIIKLKGSVGIKDISTVVKNCSEKTIQRELMALVSDGTLKKSGDRRWSVYSLVS